MAMTKKAKDDYMTQSFGQNSETAQGGTYGLTVGGVYQATAGSLIDGDYAALNTDDYGNLLVNVAAGEVIAVSAGTITAGTINKGTISAGTIDVMKAGTITGGSIVVTAGTVTTTMGDLTGGTLDLLSSLANGSIHVTNATVDAFTADIPGGTVDYLGSAAAIGVVHNAGSLELLKAGTITEVQGGSIAVTAGTFREDPRANVDILTYGTTFGATAAEYGTLIGSAAVGAGTSLWVNDLSIINSKGGTITCMVGFGTELNGTSVLAKGDFADREGVEKVYSKAVNAGMTNQDLVCYVGGAGTIDVQVSYFMSA